MTKQEIEEALIRKLGDLKYTYRPDIRDRNSFTRDDGTPLCAPPKSLYWKNPLS